MAKRKPVTAGDRRETPDLVRTLSYYSTAGRSEIGKSAVHIECPFCRAVSTAYLWSLAGSGKRCSCGAMFTSYGEAYQWKDLADA